MIFAVGRIRWMSPTCEKLFGNLSVNRGLRRRAKRRCLVNVLSAVRAEIPAAQVADRLRILLAVAAIAADGCGERLKVGSSCVPFHLAVAREDLLHERRARARQADDEDRRGRLESLARMPGRGTRGSKTPDDLLVPHLEVHGIVEYLLALLVVTGCRGKARRDRNRPYPVRLREGKAEVNLFAGAGDRPGGAAPPWRQFRCLSKRNTLRFAMLQ